MEIKPFRLLAAERCWGSEIAGLERKGRGADIGWGQEGKCIMFRLVLFSDIVCRLEKHWKKRPIIWGEDSVSACFLSFAYLPSYRLGFNFMFWPIPPACLWMSFHSHSMTDPVLHVNSLQNSRGVLHLVGKKDQASPLCSPFLAPVRSIHT